MIRFPSIFILAALTSGTAAQATPVTFTYLSNPVDFSVYDEAWEIAWAAQDVFLFADGVRAGVSVTIECDLSGATVACPAASGFFGNGHYGNFPQKSTHSVVSQKGFTEGAFDYDLTIGADGDVTAWFFQGPEWGQVGDFRLTSDGDQWSSGFEDPEMAFFYCQFEHDSAPATLGTCENGAPIPVLDKTFELGTGTWTNDLQGLGLTGHSLSGVAVVPLPAGAPLVLTALGAFALLPRRGRAAAA